MKHCKPAEMLGPPGRLVCDEVVEADLEARSRLFWPCRVKADHPLAAVCPSFSSCTSSKNTAAIYTPNLVQAEDDAHFTELRHLVGALAVEHSGPLGFRPWGLQRLPGRLCFRRIRDERCFASMPGSSWHPKADAPNPDSAPARTSASAEVNR